tara:strand:+ start:6660 stop:7391 length:732 start_codon:yes stop_codon:yes gene_type:complete
MSGNSLFYKLSKNNKYLKNIYFFYNIYIRNRKYLKNGSQLGEEKIILDLFDNNFKGKFVDLGCFHPTRHNNTFELYKKGWRGINVDLNPFTIELFNFFRPKDININTAISNKNEEVELYYINEFNTQNTLDKNHLEFLKSHHNVSQKQIIKKKIYTEKLENILKKYNFKQIDFLNIDIEGHELKILENFDFENTYVKTICVEMIDHNEKSKEKNHKIKQILNKNFYLLKQLDINYIYINKNEK